MTIEFLKKQEVRHKGVVIGHFRIGKIWASLERAHGARHGYYAYFPCIYFQNKPGAWTFFRVEGRTIYNIDYSAQAAHHYAKFQILNRHISQEEDLIPFGTDDAVEADDNLTTFTEDEMD